ncbi:MAG: hypothetical protein ABEJ58_04455 [Halodesulfurarchaeum sp.]
MVDVFSLQAVFGVVAVVAIAMFLLNRRVDVGSTIMAVLGASAVGLYLFVAVLFMIARF